MANKCWFVYYSWLEAIESLSDSEAGRLLKCCLKYSSTGEGEILSGNERGIWLMIKHQIDRDNERAAEISQKRREAGALSRSNCNHLQAFDSNCNQERREKEKEEKRREEETPKKADAFREFAGENADLLRALREFSEMRTRIKAPLTDAAKTRLLSRLRTFPAAEWIPILDQSVDNCWKDIYALKKDEQPQPRRTSGRNVQTTPAPTVSDQVKKYGPIDGKLSKVLEMMPDIGGDL